MQAPKGALTFFSHGRAIDFCPPVREGNEEGRDVALYDEIREVVANDKWCAQCVRCGEVHLKKRMTTVLFRMQYSNPKTVCFLCDSCLTELCDRYEINV